MKIIHRYSLHVDAERKDAFQAVGVHLDLRRFKDFATFVISENDPLWAGVSALASSYQLESLASTTFSTGELDSAHYLEVLPSWHHGYPEPSDGFGYLRATYDLSDYCWTCGIGKRQVGPFRMKKIPVWGRRSILQLNWIFDEYFVKPDVWSAIFKPLDVACRPVVLNKTGVEIDSVVQLDLTAAVDLDLDGFAYEVCPVCQRKKYLPVTRGFYPAPEPTEAAAFKSSQYWGSGASANKFVLVSNELYRKVRDGQIKGADFAACAP